MCLIMFGYGWCWCNRAPWCGNCWTPAATFRAICSHASLQLPQLPSVQLRLSNRALRQQCFQSTSKQAAEKSWKLKMGLQWLCFPYALIHNVQFITGCTFLAQQPVVPVFQGQFTGAVITSVPDFTVRSKILSRKTAKQNLPFTSKLCGVCFDQRRALHALTACRIVVHLPLIITCAR